MLIPAGWPHRRVSTLTCGVRRTPGRFGTLNRARSRPGSEPPAVPAEIDPVLPDTLDRPDLVRGYSWTGSARTPVPGASVDALPVGESVDASARPLATGLRHVTERPTAARCGDGDLSLDPDGGQGRSPSSEPGDTRSVVRIELAAPGGPVETRPPWWRSTRRRQCQALVRYYRIETAVA